jgi:hypothetical protein
MYLLWVSGCRMDDSCEEPVGEVSLRLGVWSVERVMQIPIAHVRTSIRQRPDNKMEAKQVWVRNRCATTWTVVLVTLTDEK